MDDLKGESTPVVVDGDKTPNNNLDELQAKLTAQDELIKNLYTETATLKGKKEHAEYKYDRDIKNIKTDVPEKKDEAIKQETTNNSIDLKDYVSEQIFASQHKEVDSDILSFMKRVKNEGQSLEEVFNSAPVQALYSEKKDKADDKNATPKSTSLGQPSGGGESDLAMKFKAKLEHKKMI